MQVQIVSGQDFQVVTLGHYLGVTDANYSKLYQISRIIQLLAEGAEDAQFCIATRSSYIFGTRSRPPRDEGNLILLAYKGSSADHFWRTFRKLRRPRVFFRPDAETSWQSKRVFPLYSSSDTNALKLLDAKVASPFQLSLEGVGEVIRQLLHHRDDERRAEELHRLRLESQSIENKKQQLALLKEAITVSEQLEASTLSPATKATVRKIVSSVSKSQGALNSRVDATIAATEDEEAEEPPPRQLR